MLPSIQIRAYEGDKVPIFGTDPNPIAFDDVERCHAHSEVEGVPGAAVIPHLLTPGECQQFVELTEAMGYGSAAAISLGSGVRLNQTVTWLADPSVTAAIFRRAQPALPSEIEGQRPVGLNTRLRFYRYGDQCIFRPHVDGSWMGEEGQWSKMTFLIYLTSDFGGGATTFFLPAPGGRRDRPERAVSVKPASGSALLFMHGAHPLSPLHEGSLVTGERYKYVLRTDLLCE